MIFRRRISHNFNVISNSKDRTHKTCPSEKVAVNPATKVVVMEFKPFNLYLKLSSILLIFSKLFVLHTPP